MPVEFLPFDLEGVAPQQGSSRIAYPEGWYLLKVVEIDSITFNDGEGTATIYKTEVQMGPGDSQQYVGKPYGDMIGNDAERMPLHMGLFVACLGSEETVRQVAMQHPHPITGKASIPPELMKERFYMARLYQNKKGYTNTGERLPYTQQTWAEKAQGAAAGVAAAGGVMAGGTLPAVPAAPVAPAAPMAPVAPVAPAVMAPVAPPLPTAPVMAPVAPVMAPVIPTAPPMVPAVATALPAPPAPPMPPAIPGVPAGTNIPGQ